jgi:hypothetical protein
MLKSSLVAAQMASSQEGLSTMKLVSLTAELNKLVLLYTFTYSEAKHSVIQYYQYVRQAVLL